MKWKKLGLIFAPNNHFSWMVSHAANPFAVQKQHDVIRVFFTCRNIQNQSHIAHVDLDGNSNFKVLELAQTPVLNPGAPGFFDDSGVAMGCYLEFQNKVYIYYLGWNLKVTVPWLNTIGLAEWDNRANRFVKVSNAPIMDRSHEDPFSISYPSILQENNKLRMWYGSNLSWGKEPETMKHVIKLAESVNGINWDRLNKIAIDLKAPYEYAISKPHVIKDGRTYKMWYSFRGSKETPHYRVGYAESSNGFDWQRLDDDAGIDVSPSGWDSEMICYPHVFDFKGNRYMLYNGNGYGKTGFGLAILES